MTLDVEIHEMRVTFRTGNGAVAEEITISTNVMPRPGDAFYRPSNETNPNPDCPVDYLIEKVAIELIEDREVSDPLVVHIECAPFFEGQHEKRLDTLKDNFWLESP